MISERTTITTAFGSYPQLQLACPSVKRMQGYDLSPRAPDSRATQASLVQPPNAATTIPTDDYSLQNYPPRSEHVQQNWQKPRRTCTPSQTGHAPVYNDKRLYAIVPASRSTFHHAVTHTPCSSWSAKLTNRYGYPMVPPSATGSYHGQV